jgi:BirA family biotin operon repressor/biotin-[acetyl-CoA-carboxylase] ligase
MSSLDSEPGAELDLRELTTRDLGRRGHSLNQVDSTSDFLLDAAEREALHGTICVAREQRQGKGRQRRRWESAPGGLYFSVLLRPERDVASMASFSLVTGLSVVEALEPLTGIRIRLKWPNDVVVAGRKLGGILLENRSRPTPSIVVGVGLNLRTPGGGWAPELEGRAISLEEATGEEVPRHRALCAVLNALEPAYGLFVESGLAPFLPAWSERSVLRGRQVRVQEGTTQFVAEALDIDEHGRLEVRPANEPARWLTAGEVHLLEGGSA